MTTTINASTAAGGGLVQSADASGILALQTASTTAVTIDASQNVGVGTSSPSSDSLVHIFSASDKARVSVQRSGVSKAWFGQDGSGDAYIYNEANANIRFYQNSTERMRIDTSGNVGIGTSSPGAKLQVGDGTASVTSVVAGANSGSGGGAYTAVKNGSTFIAALGNYSALLGGSYNASPVLYFTSGIQFSEAGSERMRIDSSGNVNIGGIGLGARLWVQTSANVENVEASRITSANTYNTFLAYVVQAEGFNAAATALKIGKNSSTSRSINAGGTVNASGADYAEYMTKAGDFVLAKGDIAGIDANGKLTNVFADSVAFVVKSTNPSYVGGDTWGNGLEGDDLEAARQTVDRVAFSGQVPVNVMGATAGQYIVPVNDNGAIKGEAVSNPTFEQYRLAVGKVIAIEDDGRARIIVKVA